MHTSGARAEIDHTVVVGPAVCAGRYHVDIQDLEREVPLFALSCPRLLFENFYGKPVASNF